MKIEIKLDENQEETKVLIIAAKMTDEVRNILEKLSEEKASVLAGFRDELLEILNPEDIYRIYAANQKVFAVTSNGEYLLRARLYELESRLLRYDFIRISNSEIINLKKIQNFDLSYTGTIGVKLTDGTTTYASRRYINKIKETLGI